MRTKSNHVFVLAVLAHSCSGFNVAPGARRSGSVSATTALEAATALPQQETVALPAASEESKVGVLLLNLGGPETGDDVEGMIYYSFADVQSRPRAHAFSLVRILAHSFLIL